MKKEIIINGSRIHDKTSFYEEINRKFMQNESWQLAESLDAFDDLLYGGFGAIREKEEITLIWENFEANREALGTEFTINYYQEKLEHPDDFDSSVIQKRLDALREGNGQTYFEILQEIIAEHSNIELIKK
ncbi:barstar family protein [Sphingobacterium mizutaii]|uniref:barstar family protein n=1 Tax=Sphingobacterium mizutaii TaxID=1010 RepID=UPI001625F12C|nr:barstar family protein [Sphingobacterium mizutaii]